MKAVHYRGEAPMWQDFAAGVLHAAAGSYPNTLNAVQSGAGRAIAVTTTKRNKRLPDVPTFVEQDVHSKVFVLEPYITLAGPAGMPQHVVERLSALMVEAGKSERVKKLLETYGIDESAQDHIAFKKLYDSETPIWIDAVRRLGSRASKAYGAAGAVRGIAIGCFRRCCIRLLSAPHPADRPGFQAPRTSQLACNRARQQAREVGKALSDRPALDP
jgi:Tripartite tricarboxylate transporter family receptor